MWDFLFIVDWDFEVNEVDGVVTVVISDFSVEQDQNGSVQ